MTWYWCLYWAWIFFVLALCWRSLRVLFLGLHLIELVSKAAKQDIRNGDEWLWRYEMLESAGYFKILFCFWRPLYSFWDIGLMCGRKRDEN